MDTFSNSDTSFLMLGIKYYTLNIVIYRILNFIATLAEYFTSLFDMSSPGPSAGAPLQVF